MFIKLGVIGMSEGNGHPYSWSAIFNGYSQESMQHCGFPVIPQYLAQQKWPEARIANARVTRVWTQDPDLSRHIADAALIDEVAEEHDQLLSGIDAVLLARDDAEQHLALARPALEAGLPIYIDKPIALSERAMDALYALESYPGQLFTCSAMRYSTELQLTEADRQHIGALREIHAVTPKSWNKYAVHIIEPVLKMLDPDDTVVELERSAGSGKGAALSARWKSGVVTRFVATGEDTVAPIAIRVLGSKGWQDKLFTDSFTSFRAALQDFVDGIRSKTVQSPPDFNRKVVSLIEAGIARE
jgi:predicted dehydrogenase